MFGSLIENKFFENFLSNCTELQAVIDAEGSVLANQFF